LLHYTGRGKKITGQRCSLGRVIFKYYQNIVEIKNPVEQIVAVTHYWKTLIRCVPESLPCAFCRAHGKERIYRVSARKHTANKKHTATMLFTVCQALSHGERGVSPCVNPQAHGEHESHGSHAGLPSGTVCWPHSCHCLPCVRVGHTTNSNLRRVPCLAHGEDCVCRVPLSSTRRTRKKFMFLLPNFFYTLHISFGTQGLNMIFL